MTLRRGGIGAVWFYAGQAAFAFACALAAAKLEGTAHAHLCSVDCLEIVFLCVLVCVCVCVCVCECTGMLAVTGPKAILPRLEGWPG